MLPEESVVPVRKWLSLKPYDSGGFLGWSQAWKYMLAMCMFLASESSRTVSLKGLSHITVSY